jgi:dipeptide/tripeptide permease
MKKDAQKSNLSKVNWIIAILLAGFLLTLSENVADFIINLIVIGLYVWFIFLCLDMAKKIKANQTKAFWIVIIFGIFGLFGYWLYFNSKKKK